jgi:hypothetical integral membrane protein (TIGR02206 family)
MGYFGGSNHSLEFAMFSKSHSVILFIFMLVSCLIYLNRKKIRKKKGRKTEIITAVFLILFEMTYHIWMYMNGIWHVSRSLPLELCNIGLILSVVLLLTRSKFVYEILFLIALLGATQAIMTPALTYNFPHFRFFHFFFTHMIIVWVVLYFTWVRGYHPTFQSVIKLIFFINLLMLGILMINKRVSGNYWFLRHMPDGKSLLNLLGPYPWYIFSLEGLLIVFSVIAWLCFRNWEKKNGHYSHPHFH